MNDKTDNQESEFARVVKYAFASTGTIPATILFTELAKRLREDGDFAADIIDDIVGEANQYAKEVLEDIKSASQIVTLN